MEQRIRDSFHLIWLMAVVLCAALAVFALFFGSCAKGGAGVPASAADKDGWHDVPTPAAQAASAEPAEASLTPAPTDSPQPTPEPAEETPVPEPQG